MAAAIAVRDILKNERYTGDVLCRKSQVHKSLKPIKDTEKSVKDQYLIKNHHKAIIPQGIYQQAKIMLEQGNKKGEYADTRKTYPLSGRLRCNSCGSNFQRFICRGIVTWRCPTHTKSKKLCSMTGIREVLIIKALNKAFDEHYQLFSASNTGNQQLIKFKNNLASIMDVGEDKLKKLRKEIEGILLIENKTILQEDEALDRSAKLDALKSQRKEKEKRISQLEAWMLLLEEDNGYRKEAVKILEGLQNMEEPMAQLKNYMQEMTVLRAWVVEIMALSPLSFTISWNTGDTTIIEMEDEE